MILQLFGFPIFF